MIGIGRTSQELDLASMLTSRPPASEKLVVHYGSFPAVEEFGINVRVVLMNFRYSINELAIQLTSKKSNHNKKLHHKDVPTGPIQLFARILKTWHLNEEQANILLGLDPSDKDYLADVLSGRAALRGRDANDRLACLIQIRMALFAWLKDEAVEYDWLREPRVTLDDKKPMDLLLEGSMENLLLVKEYVDWVTGW